jgi:hypothetical protein
MHSIQVIVEWDNGPTCIWTFNSENRITFTDAVQYLINHENFDDEKDNAILVIPDNSVTVNID